MLFKITHNIDLNEDLTKIVFQLSSNIIKYAPDLFFCFEQIACNCHFQSRKTDVRRKLFKLVLGFSNANQKQRNIKSRIDRLNQMIKNLLSLTNNSKLQADLRYHLHGIKDSLKSIKQKVDKLSKRKVYN